MEEQKSQAPHSFDPTCLSPEGIYTIPGGVTEIAASGFKNQQGIKSINIPGSVKIIGRGAFQGCENLKHVTLNEGLVEIGEEAFRYSGLESINIPRSVKSIRRGAFDHCKNLKHIIVEEGDADRVKGLLPEEHKDKVILRKHYERAQGMIESIKVNEYTGPVKESTPEQFPYDLADIVASYLDDKAYARMQSVRISRTDDDNAWIKYENALMNAATKSASSSSALPSSSFAGDGPSSSISSGGGGEGPGKGPGKGWCSIS